jgi:hypothetical protein
MKTRTTKKRKNKTLGDLTVGELRSLLNEFDDSDRVLLSFVNLDNGQEELIGTTISSVTKDKQSGAPVLLEPSAVNWRPNRKKLKQPNGNELKKLLKVAKFKQ